MWPSPHPKSQHLSPNRNRCLPKTLSQQQKPQHLLGKLRYSRNLCNRNLLWLRLPQIPECTTRTVTKPVQLARHLSIKASLDTLLTWTVMETAWPANPTKEKVIRGNSFLPAFCLSLNSFSLNTPPSPFSVALVHRHSVHCDASKD